ncbi:hypothetical protein R6Q57_001649 [Mikania cordata]
MRGGGLGGPLLCIGDLLHDVGEEEEDTTITIANEFITPVEAANRQIHPSHLSNLYQESYKCLNEALAGTSHSWTGYTLELCLALETASKLIQSSSSLVIKVSDKIRELETITKKSSLVIKEAESIHSSTRHD